MLDLYMVNFSSVQYKNKLKIEV